MAKTPSTGTATKAAGGAAKSAGDTAKGAADKATSPLSGQLQDLMSAATELGVTAVQGKLGDLVDRLSDYAENGGGGGLLGAVTGAQEGHPVKGFVKGSVKSKFGDLKDKAKGALSGKGGGGNPKVTNIVETIEVGVPLRVAYDQWTRFTDFPSYTKKVESVEQEADEKVLWRAKIFLSQRQWEATITDQVPDERIVWRSKGDKGWVDGAVTFHELGPNLTKIVLILEYHPKGFFEKTGNLWRAQGRRARLELKHFQRHVTTQTLLHTDELEGWRGEIHDAEVVKDHETAQREAEEEDNDEENTDEENTAEEEPEENDEQNDEDEDDDEDDEEQDEPEDEDERPASGGRKGARSGQSRARRPARSGARARARSEGE